MTPDGASVPLCTKRKAVPLAGLEIAIITSAMDLKIIFRDGSTFEPLSVTALGENLYRAEESVIPLCGPEEFIRYKDVIEVELKSEREGWFRRIVQPSPYKTSIHILPLDLISSSAFEEFSQRLLELGGYWESAFGGVLIVHLCLQAEFDLDRELSQISQS
jgi:hypothetical protein